MGHLGWAEKKRPKANGEIMIPVMHSTKRSKKHGVVWDITHLLRTVPIDIQGLVLLPDDDVVNS